MWLCIRISILVTARVATAFFGYSRVRFAHFNSRPRKGGDTALRGGTLKQVGISIRAPARGATHISASGILILAKFQFAPPRRGRPSLLWAVIWICWRFQFAPPRRGRRVCCGCGRISGAISIRAPAKGATQPAVGCDLDMLEISIRAPAKGATSLLRMWPNIWCNFNSRPREGGDPACCGL